MNLETCGTKGSKTSFFRSNFFKLFTWKDHVSRAQVLADDLGANHTDSVSTVPPELTPSAQRPDLVTFWPNIKKICIVEITIPFDTNILDARQRKRNKYASLVNDLCDKGLPVIFHCFELGSRMFRLSEPLFIFLAVRFRSNKFAMIWKKCFVYFFQHLYIVLGLGWIHLCFKLVIVDLFYPPYHFFS